MRKGVNREELESGFSLYINGPKMIRKTKTGLWPTPLRRNNFHHPQPAPPPQDPPDTALPPRRCWNLEGNTDDTNQVGPPLPSQSPNHAGPPLPSHSPHQVGSPLPCHSPHHDGPPLPNHSPKQPYEGDDSPGSTSANLETCFAKSAACRTIFLQILKLADNDKKLLFDGFARHMGEDWNLPQKIPVHPGPFLSARGPTFSGKNKDIITAETKTFWEDLSDSSTIPAKYRICDSVQETSDIFESLESTENQSRTIDFSLRIFSNWGGGQVGVSRIGLVTRRGDVVPLREFGLCVRDDSRGTDLLKGSVRSGSVSVPNYAPGLTVTLWTTVQLESDVERVDLLNYHEDLPPDCAARRLSLTLNSRTLFAGEMPQFGGSPKSPHSFQM